MKSLKQELNEVFPIIAESQNSFKDWAISQFQTHNNNLSSLADAVASLGGDVEGHTHTWNEITNKPTSFNPSSHTHPISQITNLQTTLNNKANTSDLPTKVSELENDEGYIISTNDEGSYTRDTSARQIIVPRPKGGKFYYGAWNFRGAIKISMPVGREQFSWFQFKVTINPYRNRDAHEIIVGGRNYNTVQDTYAVNTTSSDVDLPVRFGYDGTNICVWIGEKDQLWDYLTVSVSDVIASYQGYDTIWAEGWNISLVTEFDEVDSIRTSNFPYADWDKIKGRPNDLATEPFVSSQDASTLQQANNHVANNYIPKEGATTKNGTLTLTSSPVIPNATLDSHAVNRGYGDGRYLNKNTGGTVNEMLRVSKAVDNGVGGRLDIVNGTYSGATGASAEINIGMFSSGGAGNRDRSAFIQGIGYGTYGDTYKMALGVRNRTNDDEEILTIHRNGNVTVGHTTLNPSAAKFDVNGDIKTNTKVIIGSEEAVTTARTISAGTGLTGGGSLSANRTINFDTTWGDNRYALQNGNYASLRARGTTAADVGLGNVRNVASYSQSEAENRFYNILSATGYLPDSITDLNDLNAGQRGLARSTVEANTPASGHNDVVTISQYGSSDLLQIVYPFRGDGKFYLRNKSGSGWSDWLKVWHDGILNPMTTDTTQTITGRKQFDQVVYAPQGFAQLVAPSLRSLKENIKPFKTSGIELINKLDISTFDYKDIEEEGETIKGVKDSIGIIADDSPDEFLNSERKAVDLYKTVFIQAKAIQELTQKVEELTKRIERLER